MGALARNGLAFLITLFLYFTLKNKEKELVNTMHLRKRLNTEFLNCIFHHFFKEKAKVFSWMK